MVLGDQQAVCLLWQANQTIAAVEDDAHGVIVSNVGDQGNCGELAVRTLNDVNVRHAALKGDAVEVGVRSELSHR